MKTALLLSIGLCACAARAEMTCNEQSGVCTESAAVGVSTPALSSAPVAAPPADRPIRRAHKRKPKHPKPAANGAAAETHKP
jgi:hypothetical protein